MFTKTKTKKTSWYVLGIFILIGTIVNAQQRKVTGKISSSDDSMGLPGVNVLIKGTSKGISTDMDGSYSIMVSDKKTVLVFNYVGYKTKEVIVGDKNTINVTLDPDVSSLEEVVVVGYGTRKKSDMTGSVSSVKASELTAYPVLSAEQALQGRAAGVAVQSNNGGEPGAPIKIRIRGGTSINASSDALIVVDGFVGASMPAPEDVASMEVLKDASATAIYGSRGSNGVILVTTKKGKTGKTNIEFNQSYSSQKVNNTIDVLNADQFAAYRSSFATNYVKGPANTNWQDEIYKSGNISNTQLSFSGGTDKVKYYLSGNYYNQEGVVLNSDLERYTILSNVDLEVTDKLKVGLNVFGSKSQRNGILTQTQSGGTGTADVVSAAYRFDPSLGIYNTNGVYTTNPIGDEIDNPFATATENINETIATTYRTNFYANYEFLKGLEFRTTLGLNSANSQVGTFVPNTLLSGKGVKGRATINDSKTTNILSENYLTYKKELGKGLLTLMSGYSYQKEKVSTFSAGATGFVTNSVSYHNLGGGAIYLQPNSSLTETEIVSLFGRVNYDLDDKYLVTFTARRDGSSNFSANNKYALFPSGAVGWNMGNENFLKDNKVISSFKWRASYGATGNPSIAPYGTLARFSETYSVIGDQIVNAVAVTVLANDNLKWETSYQSDFGVDVGLFNNKINITADYYSIKTKDLLFARPLPEYVGLANPFQIQNIGELSNKGFELGINTKNITTDNFRWTTDFNISTNKNKIVALPDNADILINSAPGHFLQPDSQILRVGEAVGSFFGYIYDGVIQAGQTIPTGYENTPGGELLRDISGPNGVPDGKITSDDKTIIGNPNPDFNAGMNNDFKYKNFDLNVFFQASVGGDILNYSLLEMASGDANPTTEALNSWTPTNTNTNVPVAAVRTKRITSRFVYDGSYIRLKNLSLGYTLPSDLVKKVGFEKVRFYISGQNLLTFTKYPGADPEVNYRNNNNERSNTNLGLDYGSYPNTKTFTMGVNLKF
ncbi:TonB-dependent receptor [Flavobacterium sp. NG2]|uniref:SusC/RagA family TonB-linked outer membrane protein n=1 Tax=Flavobacterium sp. NG2 TaxID=3097547 RepID=UPI002A82885A|nr:TonB-dependent receptor [Flavobacterium sp. NG2]WPR71162.1 TonB-dependent receptor [Flavobacterium sp. NG2]